MHPESAGVCAHGGEALREHSGEAAIHEARREAPESRPADSWTQGSSLCSQEALHSRGSTTQPVGSGCGDLILQEHVPAGPWFGYLLVCWTRKARAWGGAGHGKPECGPGCLQLGAPWHPASVSVRLHPVGQEGQWRGAGKVVMSGVRMDPGLFCRGPMKEQAQLTLSHSGGVSCVSRSPGVS